MNIGLIGAANSHSKHFCETLNRYNKHPGFTITHIYGTDDPEMCANLCDDFNLKQCDTEDEVIDACDAIVITYRKGSLHHSPAMKALRAGKPLFNDKPFTCDVEEAREIVEYAKTHNSLLCGGSNTKGISGLVKAAETVKPGDTVFITYAGDIKSEYDGYWFYGIHAAELCLLFCGQSFTAVDSMLNIDTVTARVAYPDRTCIITTSPNAYDVQVMISSSDGNVSYHRVPLDYQSVGANDFINMIKTGNPPRDYSFYLDSVRLLTEIQNYKK